MVLRIAVYGGVTCSRPIPAPWDSLLSESQLGIQEILEGQELLFISVISLNWVLI